MVKEKTFYNHVLQLVGETGYTYTEEPYWIDRPKKIYDVLCGVENQLQGENVFLLEHKGEER